MSNWRQFRKGLSPVARQVPKRDARAILELVPLLRAGAASDLAADYQMAKASLGGVVVGGHGEVSHKDMLSYFNRDQGDFDDFPSPVHPFPGQVGSTIWADLHGMQRALSWLHPSRLYRGHGAAVCVAHSELAVGLWAAYSPACQVSPVGSNDPLRPRYAFAIGQWLPVAPQSLPAGFPGSRW